MQKQKNKNGLYIVIAVLEHSACSGTAYINIVQL